KLVDAHRIKNVFQPRLGAVGAVAVIDEHANHCVGNLAGVDRFNDDAGIARKILVAGQTAEAEPEPDPRIETKSLFHRHRLKADVVGVLQNWNSAGTVEGNIEFARQTVERPIVEDVEVPFARIRPSVDKFLRIDAGGGRTGYIGNIVPTRPARAQTRGLDRFDRGDRIAGSDFANLQVGTCGDVGVAATKTLSEIGNTSELRGFEDAVRQPQPAHIGVLIGRDVKQAEKAPAEIIRRLWKLAVRGVRFQPLI